MAFRTDYEIYDALPISSDVLGKGGVELLRAGLVKEELFITARRAFAEPAQWGYVLADITRRLAAIYAAESDLTEAAVSAAIAGTFARSLRSGGERAKPTEPARPRSRREPSPNPPAKSLRAARARAPNRKVG